MALGKTEKSADERVQSPQKIRSYNLMKRSDAVRKFYLESLPDAKFEANILKAPCPFCSGGDRKKTGTLVVHLDPQSYFMGYFRCLNRCHPGGFAPYFGRSLGIAPRKIPGNDPDREYYVQDILYPTKNLNAEIKRFNRLIGKGEYGYFEPYGISRGVLEEMKIGYNGRYLVYPYFMEDGNCYAARCVLPGREEDSFWHGDERFFSEEFQIFNMSEIERCEDGALFIVEGEQNFLALKELGYPGLAVPSFANLETFNQERLALIKHLFLVVNHSPEAQQSARALATRLGFKARILEWPMGLKRGYTLCQLAKDKGRTFRRMVSSMIKSSKSFSPLASPEREHHRFFYMLEELKGKERLGLASGFEKMDSALDGIRGINIMGGQPKAGKSSFFMQVSTEVASRKVPVIYYDFENGRQKIYTRTLCRLSWLSERDIRLKAGDTETSERLADARAAFKELFRYFRVVTDRKLSPEIMRRQIDFLKLETGGDQALVVVDSLHKLPFKNLSERRTGIDEWLRQMESIRDEQNVAFLVVSELSRGEGGHYSEMPDLGAFKESGDIEYSADNAMILLPKWNPLDPISSQERTSVLWLAASRENSPGKIAEYVLEYPYWGFRER